LVVEETTSLHLFLFRGYSMTTVVLLARMAQPIAQDTSRHQDLLQLVGALHLEAHGIPEGQGGDWVAAELRKVYSDFPETLNGGHFKDKSSGLNLLAVRTSIIS
jgi:hypothetical protein